MSGSGVTQVIITTLVSFQTNMNFWDAPLAATNPGTSTPPPQMAEQASPSLNEEVTEVIGQLGRFWGGFRKQVCPHSSPSMTH